MVGIPVQGVFDECWNTIRTSLQWVFQLAELATNLCGVFGKLQVYRRDWSLQLRGLSACFPSVRWTVPWARVFGCLIFSPSFCSD